MFMSFEITKRKTEKNKFTSEIDKFLEL